MNEEEIRRSYKELRKALTSLGLAWVVHQVEGTIRAGRGVERESHIFKDEEPPEEQRILWEQASAEEEGGARRPGKPTLMMASEPWPEADQLVFLIQGVRHAIVHAARVENEQLTLLRKLGDVESVRFESEPEDTVPRILALTGQKDPRIGELGKLLDALEGEVGG